MAPLNYGGFDGLDGPDGLDGLATAGAKNDEDDLLPTFEDLTPFEVDHFVEHLQEFKLEQVGNPRWLSQHEQIEKLNWTAHSQAKEGHDEYAIDQLNTLGKVQTLIYDLMLIEVWKEKIWPLIKEKIAKFSSLRTYIPVYHEVSVANLLEICLFHRTTCEEAGDMLVDLVDFCVRKLRYLLVTPNDQLVRQVASAKECVDWDSVRILDEQFCECEFQLCMCVISIIRFLTDHRVAMPLAVTTRLLDTHDVLLLLVPLMEKAPWVRKNRISGRIEKYEEHRWQPIETDDEGRLPKLHSQVWLAIYNLVMDSECRARYEMTSLRRENLLRLRRFINEVVVDQLPPLTNLHRTLEELSISGQFTGVTNMPTATPFVVELVAEVRESLVRIYEGRWQEVAEDQLRDIFVKETPEELKRLGNMISVPKDFFDDGKPPQEADSGNTGVPQEGTAVSNTGNAATTLAWEAVARLGAVCSTASFFAAARGVDRPPDEVLVLAAPRQPVPAPGGRLRLELRRCRRGQLSGNSGFSAKERAAAEAAALARRAAEELEKSFLFAVDAPGVDLSAVRDMPFVSQKGATRTAQQLHDLLRKPGRESLLQMYSDDVAEFSVPVGTVNGEQGIDDKYVAGLQLSS